MLTWRLLAALLLTIPLGLRAEEGKADVGGRQIAYRLAGSGNPIVVIETGLGEPGLDSGSWKSVITEISKAARVLTYDRAGLGKSDSGKTPRTFADAADDLHTLLRKIDPEGRFLLVGHSVGGFIVQLLAHKHPGMVRSVVLVDSSHPDQWKDWLAALPKQSTDENKAIGSSREFLSSILNNPASNPEKFDIAAGADQLRKIRSLGATPLFVVTHSPKWKMVPDLPDAVLKPMETIWQDFQKGYLGYSSRSVQFISETAGHYVQAEDPAIVIKAVQKAMTE